MLIERLIAAIVCAATALACVGCAQQPQRDTPIVFDDFEGKSLKAFWVPGDEGSGRYAPGAVVLSSDYARNGKQSAKITLREGDVAQLGDSGQANERAELDSGKRAILDREIWYAFSFLIPPDFPIVDTRLVMTQWKQSGLAGSPIVAQRFVGGRHYVTIRDLRTRGSWRETLELPKVVPGQWNDMIYRIRFARDDSGVVEILMNGQHVARFDGPTASSEGKDHFYHKVGLYRDRMAVPMTIYIDDYSLAHSREGLR